MFNLNRRVMVGSQNVLQMRERKIQMTGNEEGARNPEISSVG